MMEWIFDLRVIPDATPLRDGLWAVRPLDKCGTCGFHPVPWAVIYVKARNADDAISRAEAKAFRFRNRDKVSR